MRCNAAATSRIAIPNANNAVRQILHHINRRHLNLRASNLPQSPPRRSVFFDRVHMPRCLSHEYRPVDAGLHKLKSSDLVSALHVNTPRSGNVALLMRVRDLCLAAAIILGSMTSSANADISVVQGTPVVQGMSVIQGTSVVQGRPHSLLILDQSTSFRTWPSATEAAIIPSRQA